MASDREPTVKTKRVHDDIDWESHARTLHKGFRALLASKRDSDNWRVATDVGQRAVDAFEYDLTFRRGETI